MAALDPQYFDIQPQKDNNNILFNDLVNVVPVAHPWTGMWYRNHLRVSDWDKERHWFDKRKWFKVVDLYEWICWRWVISEWTNSSEWNDWEFTDMILFEWHRWFLRTNRDKTKIRLYVQWFVNPEECTDWVYYPITTWQIINVTSSIDWAKKDSNWYYLDFIPCAYDRFVSTWWLRWKNNANSIAELRDWKWVLRALTQWTTTVWTLYDTSWKYKITSDVSYIRLNDSWMVVTNAWEICADIASEYWIPEWAIFVNWAMSQQYLFSERRSACSQLSNINEQYYENKIDWWITVGYKIWSTFSFFNLNWLTSVSSYEQIADIDWRDFDECFELHTFDIPWLSSKTNWIYATSVALYNNRLAILRSDWTLSIWWEWQNQSWFPSWILNWTDKLIWFHSCPSWITDVIAYNNFLVLIWPHSTHYFAPEHNDNNWWIFEITDRSWYFSKWSWAVKDWKIFIARSYKDLYYLEWSSYYWSITWSYNYYSQYINSHLRSLHRTHDKINIDLTDNNTYVCIFDNNYDEKYSKILIQDRQYNFWYTWVINWCKISRVKDWIFFWDRIYSNEWLRDHWNEIIEVISATWWDETIQSTKHFVNLKVAVWENTHATKNTLIETNATVNWLEQIERIRITPARYPKMISNNTKWIVHQYDTWQVILSEWKKDEHTLQQEIEKYKKYNPEEELRDVEAHTLWTYSPLKFAINRDWELLKMTAIAMWEDNLEFGWFFFWYIQQDFDFWDIADTVITPSVLTYASEKQSHELPAVEDPMVLWHF